MTCPFCPPDSHRVVATNAQCIALRDGFPVSPGHTLVIPRRHVASLSELTPEEQSALWSLVAEARQQLDASLRPHGYNIGINDGVAAGQTVMHLHVHLIPRYTGDLEDPRGGVRWVIPHKADYWSGPRDSGTDVPAP
jgi:diadenosine tetraphosphate (Ap4A) HIT family hydrolase